MGTSVPKLERDGRGYFRARWYDDGGVRRQRNFGRARAAAVKAFREWIVTWERDSRVRSPASDTGLTVAAAWDRYADHAESYYRRPDGTPTGHAAEVGYAFRPLVSLHGPRPVASITVADLRDVRDRMVDDRLSITTINARVHQIRRVFRWLVANGLCPTAVWQELLSLDALRPGRSDARIPRAVQPVDDAAVDATCAKLPPTIAAMVRIQHLTGMRPGEVCAMSPAEVDVSGPVWIYRPTRHKTAHRGRVREVMLGPLAQAVLRPYLDRDPDRPCFRPVEALKQRADLRVRSYAPPLGQPDYRTTPSYRRRWANREFRPTNESFSVVAYAQAIRRAAEEAGVQHWSPNRLRHSAATRIRAELGLEAAQAALGHAKADVTQIYAARDRALAMDVARRLG
jgi:integrase